MKLILTQEVPGLGSAGDAVDVKDGYGRNYLIPRGFAMAWTKGAQKEIDAIQLGREKRVIADLDTARAVKDKLEAAEVRLEAKAGTGGRLFGSITPAEIAKAITAAGGPQVDKRRIEVGRPIKTVGSHSIVVRLHPDVAATVSMDVVEA